MSKRSAAHMRAQRLGRDRDLNTCQVCGSRERVEGHHIIDHYFGGSATTGNIISLCHNCHTAVHRGGINLLKF